MKRNITGLLIGSAFTVCLYAQDIKIPVNFEKLAERAAESVDVTLDSSLLQLASGFLSKSDPDEMKVKQIVAKLKGVYVRSLEFDKEGQYSMSDVEAIRLQMKAPGWSKIVSVKSIKGNNTEIYLKKDGDQIGGLVVLDAEPKQLTLVHIDGPINPEELSQLSGHLGIPPLGAAKSRPSRDRDRKEK